MATVVELPRLSDTMEEGVIAKWHIAEGQKVKRGQVIAEIETDKATMEFESFDAGTVLRLVAPEGEALPLGAPIAVLGKPGEDFEAELSKHGGAAASAPPAPEPVAPSSAPTVVPGAVVAPRPTPVPAPVPAPQSTTKTLPPRDDGRIPASPVARRLAREHGIALATVNGSGPHGRVVKADVEKAASAGATGVTPGAPSGEADAVGRPYVARPDATVRLSQMRKTIARRMSQANAEIPHFYLTIDAAMDRVVQLRREYNDALSAGPSGGKVSFNDVVVMAVAKALVRHPEINAYWDGQQVVRRGDVHVGVAVAVDDGLIVPVVRFADQKSLAQIGYDTRDMAVRARDKALLPQEMTGSTMTVSNLGMFGIEEFAAVINPGEGAIVAVGAIRDTVVAEDGAPAIRKRMKVTMACDHRVMDGAMGAKFMATVRQLLEQPLGLFT